MSDWLERLTAAGLPELVMGRAKVELDRLANETVDRRELDRYLETLMAVPWDRLSPVHPVTVTEARVALDEQHVGLERAKLRVLEEVAVRAMSPAAPQPLFFFVGPPYTGKSHFAQTIATLFGRPFVRFSLAGAARESDLRGRDRGSAHPHPGIFIDALIEAGVRDPVIYLDEADKLEASEGDPVDALLAALEHDRSGHFLDRYLGIPIDLSRALIILAGQGDALSPAVAGRVTYVDFAGYTLREKEEIARRFLLPRQAAVYGLENNFKVSDRALRDVIEGWTYEPGVGRLAARLDALARAAALEIVEGRDDEKLVDSVNLEEILGPRPLDVRAMTEADRTGVVNGLVMNATEGAVTAVEAFTFRGREDFFVTGSVGTIMRESCRVAWTVVRNAEDTPYALPPTAFAGKSLHLHFPKGAVDKEGPSAGIAIAVAIYSQFAGIAVKHDVAMTGELNLEGQVLRIGGLKKKVLGAHRAGARIVVIPAENRPDLVDIPQEVRDEIEIILVTRFEEVLERALVKPVAKRGRARPSRAKAAIAPPEPHEPREHQAGAVTPLSTNEPVAVVEPTP